MLKTFLNVRSNFNQAVFKNMEIFLINSVTDFESQKIKQYLLSCEIIIIHTWFAKFKNSKEANVNKIIHQEKKCNPTRFILPLYKEIAIYTYMCMSGWLAGWIMKLCSNGSGPIS